VGGAPVALRGGGALKGLRLVSLMPRRAVSRAMGFLASSPMPRAVLTPVLWAYARGFRADLTEAARPLSAYRTFDDFFTRELRDGLRPVDADPAAVVSPVDGTVYASGPVVAGTILQAKGVPYSVAELVGSSADAAPFDGGTYLTAYLSPRDYHRIHWPFDALVGRVRHLPGDLWPVNARALAGVPRLFARNERVAVLGRTMAGPAFALVPVGALNVGSIRLAFRALRTNRGGCAVPRTFELSPAVHGVKGAEAARFSFGSAVVLLLSRDAGRLDAVAPGTTLRYGARIGTLTLG
jgi:phosphatidylserine decarboxylase